MEYHQDRFDDFSLMIFKSTKLVAVLPANREDNVLYSHQGLTYGDLVLDKGLKLFDVASILKSILLFLENNGIEKLIVKKIPSIYCKTPSDELEYLFFILKANLIRVDTLSVLKLDHLIKFSKDRLAGIKRGAKNGLCVLEENKFDAFWNHILIPNLKEKFKVNPTHSLDEIQYLKSKFPDKIRLFNVYHEEKLVAGTVIFETDLVAHSQYISSLENRNEIGSIDYLHEHLITKVFQSKKYFDFGISNEESGRKINQGLQYWKEGFGARTIVQNFYELDVVNFKLLNSIWI